MRGSSRLSFWLTVLLLAAVTGTAAAGQHRERKRVQRAEIGQLEQQWRQAQLTENVSEMDHLLSDDFLGILAAGQVVTKVQELDRMRSHQLEITRLDITDSKVKISGRLAVVTSLARIEGLADGKRLTGYFRYTQVYERAGTGWKMTNFEATHVRGSSAATDAAPSPPGASLEGPPAAAPSSAPASPATPASRPPQS